MAPETLRLNAYSVHTDTWQAGVVLYCLLSGGFPFELKSDRMEDLLASGMYDGRYEPMDGPRWRHVSPEAKALVARMLSRYGINRPSLDDALHDPWLNNASISSPTPFDDAYVNRIRGLAARKDLQRMVLGDVRQQKCDLLHNATIIDSRYTAMKGVDVLTKERVLTLQRALLSLRTARQLQHIDSSDSRTTVESTGSSTDSAGASADGLTIASEELHNDSDSCVDILSLRVNRSEFDSIMRSIGLQILACDKVFDIFVDRTSMNLHKEESSGVCDQSNRSRTRISARSSLGPTIQLKDVLLTSLSLAFGRDSVAHFDALFDIFDFNGDGQISRSELCNALAMYPDIFLSESSQNAAFDAMDTDKDGHVSKEEFSRFLHTLCNECTRN
jgi:serine/threonine protein kinase